LATGGCGMRERLRKATMMLERTTPVFRGDR
jgi:hypothetical protein